MSSPLLPIAAALLLTLAARAECAAQEPTSASSSVDGTARASSAASGAASARNVLTPESWTLDPRGDAHAMLARIRPNWLRARDLDRGVVPSIVQVYLNGSRMGGVETLRQIQTSGIARIEYMSGIDATVRFGTNHGAGAILVTTH